MSRIVRYVHEGQGPRWGEVQPEGSWVQPLACAPYDAIVSDGPPIRFDGLKLLAPVEPSKIIGVGSNYRAHVAEMGRELPSVPKIFLMPPSAVIGPGAAIEIPPRTRRVDHEAELGVVVGRRMVRVPEAVAMAYVFGYTCVNDVTARDLQRSDGVFSRAKGFDSFCPVGPWIETELGPDDVRVRCWVDEALRQEGRTSDLIFGLPRLLAFISSVMTLLPGDVISTGTPSGVGPLRHGQTVRVDVEGIGQLWNPVVNRADRIESSDA